VMRKRVFGSPDSGGGMGQIHIAAGTGERSGGQEFSIGGVLTRGSGGGRGRAGMDPSGGSQSDGRD
jgi:hypothetical protein